MKSLEMYEQLQKNQGGNLQNYSCPSSNCPRVSILISKQCLDIVLYPMVIYGKKMFGYSCILMKSFEMNDQLPKESRGLLTKLLISRLLIALEYQT